MLTKDFRSAAMSSSDVSFTKYTLISTLSLILVSVESNSAPTNIIDAMTERVTVITNTEASET